MSKPTGSDTDIPMPEGNGDKNCPKCRGRGVVPIELNGWPGGGTQNCGCVFRRDLVANVKRVWPVLLTVESAEDSPLMGLHKQSLWLTASNFTLRRHLRYVAFRMGTQWDARVIADATLVTAWLSTAKEAYDPDVLTERREKARGKGKRGTPSEDFQTLVDLAVPFDLLIIRLGIKSAANKEMANVLTEAIHERELVGKPTWVADSPGKPLVPGHRCYSEDVIEALSGFRRLTLSEQGAPTAAAAPYPQRVLQAPSAPVPQQGGMSPSRYPTKAVVFQDMSMATPGPRPVVPSIPLADDGDEFSVGSLIADAHTPDLGQVAADPEVEETEEEGDYPLTFEDVVGKKAPRDLPERLLAAARRRKGGEE